MPNVLILGATSDIGFAIAKKFASEDYAVQLASRNVEQLSSFKSDISIRYNVPCSVHAFDAEKFETHPGFYQSLEVKPD
ncbi:MAG: SDR family NAD(P)-dependent oxidoreductase, partial [Flavisolibacter sp.]